MPLTPEDVRNKRFTPVRLREGYDMGEVDQFLDEVETELERLAAADTVAPGPTSTASTADDGGQSGDAAGATPDLSGDNGAVQRSPLTVTQASAAATRLMELAGRNADEVLAEAGQQAEQIERDARTEADRVREEAAARAEAAEAEASARAENLDAETTTRRTEMVAHFEREREALTAEIVQLRAFEQEYRSRLTLYFADQLAKLEGTGTGSDPLVAVETSGDGDPDAEREAQTGPPPSRLQSLLGEDPPTPS